MCATGIHQYNTTDFCLLTLYFLALLYLLINSSSQRIHWDFLCKLMYHMPIGRVFTSSLPSYEFYFICLRTSGTVLHSNGRSTHACLVPSLRGKELSLSVLNVMLAVGFTEVLLVGSVSFPVEFTEEFLVITDVEFCQELFSVLLKIL